MKLLKIQEHRNSILKGKTHLHRLEASSAWLSGKASISAETVHLLLILTREQGFTVSVLTHLYKLQQPKSQICPVFWDLQQRNLMLFGRAVN